MKPKVQNNSATAIAKKMDCNTIFRTFSESRSNEAKAYKSLRTNLP